MPGSDLWLPARHRNVDIGVDGQLRQLRSTRSGQLFTADWKKELVLAGHVYSVTVGGISAGADVALIQGGGAGTTIDSDQPELAVGVPSGYTLIPLEFLFSGQVDLDADAEVGNVILFADLTQNIPAPVIASSTLETPSNMLDGGEAFPGYAQSAVTTDITDPVLSEMLVYETIRAAETTAAGQLVARLSVDWKAETPFLMDGPCSLIACWGGTAAVSGMAKLVFACVPRARYLS